jgi:cysteinyl-tRNA synthetase
MARQYLGDTLDLHSGGEDNIFPHHECEIAQSESLTGKRFCDHWVHTRFLLVNGQKMAKSAGNFYTVQMLMEKGISPLAIRYALISAAFSKQLNLTDQSLLDAVGNVERLQKADALADAALALNRPGGVELNWNVVLEQSFDRALGAMCEDLNTSVALASALHGAKIILGKGESMTGEEAASAKEFLNRINGLLGIVRSERDLHDCPEPDPEKALDEHWIEEKIAARAAAKSAKDFGAADSIRKEIEDRGIELRDSPTGTTWHVKTRIDLT